MAGQGEVERLRVLHQRQGRMGAAVQDRHEHGLLLARLQLLEQADVAGMPLQFAAAVRMAQHVHDIVPALVGNDQAVDDVARQHAGPGRHRREFRGLAVDPLVQLEGVAGGDGPEQANRVAHAHHVNHEESFGGPGWRMPCRAGIGETVRRRTCRATAAGFPADSRAGNDWATDRRGARCRPSAGSSPSGTGTWPGCRPPP